MLQHGSYTLLIDACYDREIFPTLEEAIDWTWASSKEEIEAVEFVLRKFFTLTDGVYIQSRIQQELEEYVAQKETNAINGKKGGRPSGKKTNPALTESVNSITQSVNLETEVKANESLNHKPLTTNHKPLTNNHKPITNTKSIVEAKPQRVDHVQPIFDYWVETMGKTAASKLTAGRRKCISARLKEGYTVDQIKLAITGCARSPHHMGQNSEGTIYDDLTLICRNGENIERFSQNIAKVIPNATYQPSSQPAVNSNDTSWADEIINASEQECSSSSEQDFQRLEGDSFGMEAGSFIGFDGGRH